MILRRVLMGTGWRNFAVDSSQQVRATQATPSRRSVASWRPPSTTTLASQPTPWRRIVAASPTWYPTMPRQQSTVAHAVASKDAPREVPTPLVLVSASRWSGEQLTGKAIKAFQEHFTRHGWNVTHIDVDPKGAYTAKTSQGVLAVLEDELAKSMSKAAAGSGGAPFPPIMIAAGLATLIAEQYVSSYPLSGLVLVDPPLTPQHAHEASKTRLPTPLDPFTYEIRFPARVAWTQDGVQQLAYWDVHRIEEAREDEADEALERIVWDCESAADDLGAGPHEMRKWAEDECGIDEPRLPEPTDEVAVLPENVDDGGDAPPTKEPAWFLQGNYERSQTGSKKEPLLLDRSDLEESFIRGSGPGGQAINKLSTCVQLKHLPTGIVLKCQETRNRSRNRVIARERMSREIELLVFGKHDSVLGKGMQRLRNRKAAKGRKQARKSRERQKGKQSDVASNAGAV